MNLEILGLILLLIVLNLILSLFTKQNNTLACGLTGFSGKDNFDITKLKFLLYWNSVERGRDATGLYTLESGIVKDNEEAKKFIINAKKIDKINPSNLLIGHVRAKTVGNNTVANAHPFEYGDLVGAHNGSLTNHLALIRQYGFKMTNYDVDSQVLISALNENLKDSGSDDFKVLSEYEGAAALLIYNKKEGILYAMHDKERPLFYGYDNGNMYISSIKESLEGIGCIDCKAFPINVVHMIKDGEIIHTIDYKPYVPKITTPVFWSAAKANFKYGRKGKLTLDEKYCGIYYSDAEAYMFEGYNVMVESSMAATENPGRFNKDNWYLCTGFTKNSTGKLEPTFIDNKGDETSLPIVQLDTNNFIPVKGSYVKVLIDIVYTGTQIKICNKGDIVEVTGHKFGDDQVHLRTLDSNKTFYIDLDAIRNLSSKEMNEHIANMRKQHNDYAIKEREITQQQIALMLAAPTCEIEEIDDDQAPIDIPFTNVTDEEEIMIPYSTYMDLIELFSNKVEDMEKCIDNYNFLGMQEVVDEIKDMVVEACDMANE